MKVWAIPLKQAKKKINPVKYDIFLFFINSSFYIYCLIINYLSKPTLLPYKRKKFPEKINKVVKLYKKQYK